MNTSSRPVFPPLVLPSYDENGTLYAYRAVDAAYNGLVKPGKEDDPQRLFDALLAGFRYTTAISSALVAHAEESGQATRELQERVRAWANQENVNMQTIQSLVRVHDQFFDFIAGWLGEDVSRALRDFVITGGTAHPTLLDDVEQCMKRVVKNKPYDTPIIASQCAVSAPSGIYGQYESAAPGVRVAPSRFLHRNALPYVIHAGQAAVSDSSVDIQLDAGRNLRRIFATVQPYQRALEQCKVAEVRAKASAAAVKTASGLLNRISIIAIKASSKGVARNSTIAAMSQYWDIPEAPDATPEETLSSTIVTRSSTDHGISLSKRKAVVPTVSIESPVTERLRKRPRLG